MFVIDNDSDDETLTILEGFEKVHVFHTKQLYKNHWYWQEHLLDKYGKNSWCLVVDADEFLDFPYSSTITIREFCKFLDSSGQEALHCPLLDMYSKGPISTAEYEPGKDPLEICNFFDLQFDTKKISGLDRKTYNRFKFEFFTGNVRDRVFGYKAVLSKIVLFKYRTETYLTNGHHFINNAKLSDLQGVVRHFKFMGDFFKKMNEEIKREQYWNKAVHWKAFSNHIKNPDSFTLYGDESIKYENNEQLVKLGLMKSSDELDAYVNKLYPPNATKE